jgi:predicted phosphodiesterase
MSDLPNILFAGDPHGDFRPIVRSALARKPDSVVLLGDYDLERPLHDEMKPLVDAGIPIHWIAGNHDFDTEAFHDRLFLSDLKAANLHRRIAFVGKMSLTGLGGVIKTRVWDEQNRPIYKTRADLLRRYKKAERFRGGLPLDMADAIFHEDLEWISKRRFDILVMHEAPTTHEQGWPVLDDIVRRSRAKFVVHGHPHKNYLAQLGDATVIGVGKSGVASLVETIVPGLRERGSTFSSTGSR